MKIGKITAIIFCTLTLIPKVFACTLAEGANPNTLEENQKLVFLLIGISLLFSIATFLLYFKRNKKGILAVIISLLVVGFTFLTSNVYVGDCGYNAFYFAKIGIGITLVCFLIQFSFWFLFRKKSFAELP